VILNGGDELTLEFANGQAAGETAGQVRNFFLYTVGWDKDADFHVELGWKSSRGRGMDGGPVVRQAAAPGVYQRSM